MISVRIGEAVQRIGRDDHTLIGDAGLIHQIIGQQRREPEQGGVVPFRGGHRIAGESIARGGARTARGEGSGERIGLIEVAAGEGVFAVDDVIPVAHGLMVIECGDIRECLIQVAPIGRVAGISARARKQITPVGKLHLQNTQGDRIDVPRIAGRYAAGRGQAVEFGVGASAGMRCRTDVGGQLRGEGLRPCIAERL